MDETQPTTPDPSPALPAPAAPTATPDAPQVTYRGNSNDLYAIIAGIAGIASLALCFTGGAALYCLPLVPVVFGIIALRNSSRAVDPSRTRTWGWVGLIVGGVAFALVVVMLLFFAAYFAFIIAIIGTAARQARFR